MEFRLRNTTVYYRLLPITVVYYPLVMAIAIDGNLDNASNQSGYKCA
jgi:hypothetical protein